MLHRIGPYQKIPKTQTLAHTHVCRDLDRVCVSRTWNDRSASKAHNNLKTQPFDDDEEKTKTLMEVQT
jgi:hypothetical protein